MSTFSKPSAVVEIIDDAITAKVRAHVPTDQIYKKPADHWWSDDAATLKLNVAGSVIKTKDGKSAMGLAKDVEGEGMEEIVGELTSRSKAYSKLAGILKRGQPP